MPDIDALRIEASRTATNLRHAFADETIAGHRCLARAERAEAAGIPAVASLWRQAAGNRRRRAMALMEALEPEPATGTAYNLRAAIMHEVHACADMYPGMARTAREEGLEDIALWFETRARASRVHAARFRRALDTSL
jgi:rubrerythrin